MVDKKLRQVIKKILRTTSSQVRKKLCCKCTYKGCFLTECFFFYTYHLIQKSKTGLSGLIDNNFQGCDLEREFQGERTNECYNKLLPILKQKQKKYPLSNFFGNFSSTISFYY